MVLVPSVTLQVRVQADDGPDAAGRVQLGGRLAGGAGGVRP